LSVSVALTLTFQLRFKTTYGQQIFVTGNHPVLGNGDVEKAVPLQFFNEDFWYVQLEIEPTNTPITYNYFVQYPEGNTIADWGKDRTVNPAQFDKNNQLLLLDTWNHAGYFHNAFYTEAFQQVLLKQAFTPVQQAIVANSTHTFRVKYPLLPKGKTLCLLGSNFGLGSWNTEHPIVMSREENSVWYVAEANLSSNGFPVQYKYGVYDTELKQFIQYEEGNNRILFDAVAKDKHTLITDGFANLPANIWKGTGLAIPVFSLRSNDGLGVGEFADIPVLADWCSQVNIKLIQLLPINDTTATHTWKDSYPYAAISAFALHPIYLRLDALVQGNSKLEKELSTVKAVLNQAPHLEYDAVMDAKWKLIKAIYPQQYKALFATESYQLFFTQNKHWLVPYAAFCYLRDEYKTANFNEWPAYRQFNTKDIDELTAPGSNGFEAIALHYFVQYHLHLQLTAATQYCHSKSIIVKGDIPIGIYRYGVDAWQAPQLYHINVQAGAPPDDFAVKGQNWGFPTYNWEKMREDGFSWWKQRFEQMSYYFDAFRIDHILGFFRIWSIPMHAVEGIMGYFVPAIPIHIHEFNQNNIWFDYNRYTQPFINDQVLWDEFGNQNEFVQQQFLDYDGYGNYTLKPAFNTQRKVEAYFATLEASEQNQQLQQGLYNLISNVILFVVEESQGQQFHFRFGIENISSFKNLEENTRHQLQQLYINYFFRRQDEFWKQEALNKLPALKSVTNMLICGEDLGMVPASVPDVMKQLGLLSLEIQRMPKDPTKAFFHPADAPYLSVVTPSTHDMSTIRGWWEEDTDRTQQFYNNEMGQYGKAPFYCEAWVNKAIVVQHLYSTAMWSIFQLQDLLGIDADLRRENPQEERINIPSNPTHYWRYRMHIGLEKLQTAKAFNTELKQLIDVAGR
jgi:4-alpha-glucanotransferase